MDTKGKHRRAKTLRNVLLLFAPPIRPPSANDHCAIAEEFFKACQQLAPCLGDDMVEPCGGLLALGTVLVDAGHDVRYLDLNAHYALEKLPYTTQLSDRRIAPLLDNALIWADVVLLSATTASFPTVCYVAHHARQLDPVAPVVLGGIHATLDPVQCADALPVHSVVVAGPAESRIKHIIDALEAQSGLSKIPGIVVHTPRGPKRTSGRTLHRKRERDVVSPAWQLVDSRRFRPVYRVFSSYGCQEKCTFCAPALANENRAALVPVRQVMRQLDRLHDEYSATEFLFGDLTFFHDPQHGLEICRLLERRRYSMGFWCQTRVDRVTPETAMALAKAGCRQLALGIETADSSLLRRTHKSQPTRAAKQALKLLRAYPFSVQAYIMAGFPGETSETLLKTADFLEACLTGDLLGAINVAQYVPFPGIHQPRHMRIIDHDLSAYSMASYPRMTPSPVFSTPHLASDELRALYQSLMATCTRALYGRYHR